jgi:hypothetical protein
MTQNIKSLILIGFIALSPSFARANTLLLGIDFTGGGDTTARFTDGTEQRAGDGVGLHIGYELEVSEQHQFFVRATVGKSADDPDLSYGFTKLERTPYTLLVMKKIGNHQFGGGAAYHTNQTWNFSSSGFGSDSIEYKNALGLTMQYGWQFSRHGELGAKYTNIEYDREDGGRSVDASNIGIYINFKLPH